MHTIKNLLGISNVVKLILALFLAAAVFAVGALLYINHRMHKGISGIVVKTPNADISIAKARYVETRDGRKEWELEADSARYFKNDDLIAFENMKVVFYSKNGANYVLEGKQGKLKNDTKDMDVSGDVVVTSSDGYKLLTDSLKYTAAVKQISTKDRVIFTGPNIRIEGIGFLADMVTEKVSVLANVKTVLKNAAI